MGFTKLDDGIIYSSVMGEDDSVFRVWIILLASCKSNGISPLSPIFIKNITGKTIEEINRCLHILSEPDINSRSKNDDGRRIRSVDGGFLVINYKKYRDFTYSDSPEAIKKRMQRDKKGHVPDISGHSASASISSSASTSVESKEGMQGEKVAEPSENELTFEVFRKEYPGTKRGLKTEYDNFRKKHGDHKTVLPLLSTALSNQKQWRVEMAAVGMFIPEWPGLAVWINQRRWELEKPVIENKSVKPQQTDEERFKFLGDK